MAAGDSENDQPSLELPKLSLRRRKKKEPAPAPLPVEETAVLPPTPPPPTPPPPPPAPELAEPPPLFVDEVEPMTADERPRPVVVDEMPAVPEAPEPTRRAIKVRGPGGMVAAVLTGIVVGLGMVGLTWASLRLCETVQGTSSCGGTGYPLLAAILVLMVIVGTLLLKLSRVAEPGSTSFLAVGLTAVLALLFLVDSLLDTAMIVVIPVISAASYAASHWVTRTFIEPAEH
ncbi:MAG: hypothetical protein JWN91_811 [Nocardioides sp.]|jgi:hypothetical protein|nr:hypothetical protein [Nocardioides sp.]